MYWHNYCNRQLFKLLIGFYISFVVSLKNCQYSVPDCTFEWVNDLLLITCERFKRNSPIVIKSKRQNFHERSQNRLLQSYASLGFGVYLPVCCQWTWRSYVRVMYVRCPYKAHGRLQLVKLRTQHLVLWFCLYFFVVIHVFFTAVRIL